MTVKLIKERFEIEENSIITIEIDPSSVEAEEFVTWLNNEHCFDAELAGQCENNVSGDFKEDDYSGNTLLNMLWESYCNE